MVFDAVDRVLETLRERWPRTLLAVGLTLWSLATATIAGVYILGDGPSTGVLMVVLPVALLILIARRGIDRLPWPVWPLGVLLPVVLAGLLAPQAPRFAKPGLVRGGGPAGGLRAEPAAAHPGGTLAGTAGSGLDRGRGLLAVEPGGGQTVLAPTAQTRAGGA